MHPVPEQVEEGGICVGGGTDRGRDEMREANACGGCKKSTMHGPGWGRCDYEVQ